MIRRTLGILMLALIASLALAAASSSHWQHVPPRDHLRTNPMDANPEAIAAGAILYRDHCLQCHKSDAEGDGHKRPSLRAQSVRSATDGDIEWFLRQGDLRHGMPSWSALPEAQRWQIVAYLRSLQ